MPVKCPQCGSICRDNARFCDTCGSGLSVMSGGVRPAPSPPAQPHRETPRSYAPSGFLGGWWKIPPAIILWVVAVCGTFMSGIGLAFCIREPNDEAYFFTAIFLIAAVAVVFLLTRFSPRTWFRYFGVFLIVMFLSTLIDPDIDSSGPRDYNYVSAAIGLVAGLFVLKPGKVQGRKTIWGRVTEIQPRYQTTTGASRDPIEVLSFRLQETSRDFEELRRDHQQNPLPALAVEIRAREISGAPQNGDKVEIHGSVAKGVFYASRVINYSTRSEVVMKDCAGIP
jgi:hypothetical protein